MNASKVLAVLVAVVFALTAGIASVNATGVGGVTADPNYHAVNLADFEPGHTPLALGGDVFYVPPTKILASGNFPTTAAQLADGGENPLGSVSANFGQVGSWKGAQPF